MIESDNKDSTKYFEALHAWKRGRGALLALHRQCHTWVKNHGLPDWVGYIPVLFSGAGLLVWWLLMVFCHSISAGVLTILLHLKGVNFQYNTSKTDGENDDDHGPVYTNGNDGEGWYTDDTGSIRQDH